MIGDTEQRLGMVGLGLLGSAIVERLRARGYRVFGYDVDAARASLVDVDMCSSPAELASAADRVVLCLPDSPVVELVVEGAGGLMESGRPPRLVVDTTTGEPERSSALARRLRERGTGYVEAAVSGSSEDMRRGDAVLLVGASPGDLESARDVLDALVSVVYHLGDVGAGLRAKLASNLLLGLHRLALAEALVLGEAMGLSAATLLEVLRSGPAYSRVIDTKGAKMAGGDFRPQARLKQHLKDVRLILEQGERLDAVLPLTRAHAGILERGVESGHGDEDNSVVLQVLREMASRDPPLRLDGVSD